MATLNQPKSPGHNRSLLASIWKVLLISILFLAACFPQVEQVVPQEISTLAKYDETTVTENEPTAVVAVSTLPATQQPTSTETPVPTTAPAPTQLPSLTPSPVPTYSILRGTVNEEHVMCFYGPSKAYLYKYGLLGGNRLEIIGILKDTGYIQIRAIGGTNPCWMNLDFMDVQGDISLVQPVDPLEVDLPISPYYGALASVSATRAGDDVTITWSPMVLRAGDDSEQEPYLVETWVCLDGMIVFMPFGLYETEVTVVDEPGCSQPSFGRVYGVEKHGYTPYLSIDWPEYSE